MSDGQQRGVPEPPVIGPFERRAQRHAARAQRRADRRAHKYGYDVEELPETPPDGVDPAEWRARRRARQLRGFYRSLAGAAGILAFFFLINLLTSAGSWWFYWIAIPLGIGLFWQAYATFGPENWFDQSWEDRKVQQMTGKAAPAAAPTAKAPAPGEVGQLVAQGVSEVAKIRQMALRIATPAVREQALAICASADRILGVLAEHPDDARTARDFLDRYLQPTQTIVAQYVRLTSRGVAAAEPALATVEQHDLPLLDTKMDELYQRLHRGDVIDLQVASEMLDLELAGPAEPGSRAVGPPS